MHTRCWLLATDLHGQLRTKLVVDPNHKSTFAGVFVNDRYDHVIDGLEPADKQANVLMSPDESSRRWSPWNEQEYYMFCDGKIELTHEVLPSKVCPRTFLKQVVEHFKEIGLHVTCGMEMEWTMMRSDGSPLFDNCASYVMHPLLDTELEDYKNAIFTACDTLDIPVEAFHVENGRGILEMALGPSDPVTVGDNAQLFKMLASKEALRRGWKAEFKSKIFPDTAGNGAHLHVSLQDMYHDNENLPQLTSSSFLAGILHMMTNIAPLYLPTMNSYERIGGRYWTASTASWGIDERAHAVRVINRGKHTERLEVRIAGADACPYLVMYATLMSGWHGIMNNMELQTQQGQVGVQLPTSLTEACDRMEKDEETQALFGKAFVKHYIALRRADTKNNKERSEIDTPQNKTS